MAIGMDDRERKAAFNIPERVFQAIIIDFLEPTRGLADAREHDPAYLFTYFMEAQALYWEKRRADAQIRVVNNLHMLLCMSPGAAYMFERQKRRKLFRNPAPGVLPEYDSVEHHTFLERIAKELYGESEMGTKVSYGPHGPTIDFELPVEQNPYG